MLIHLPIDIGWLRAMEKSCSNPCATPVTLSEWEAYSSGYDAAMRHLLTEAIDQGFDPTPFKDIVEEFT